MNRRTEEDGRERDYNCLLETLIRIYIQKSLFCMTDQGTDHTIPSNFVVESSLQDVSYGVSWQFLSYNLGTMKYGVVCFKEAVCPKVRISYQFRRIVF